MKQTRPNDTATGPAVQENSAWAPTAFPLDLFSLVVHQGKASAPISQPLSSILHQQLSSPSPFLTSNHSKWPPELSPPRWPRWPPALPSALSSPRSPSAPSLVNHHHLNVTSSHLHRISNHPIPPSPFHLSMTSPIELKQPCSDALSSRSPPGHPRPPPDRLHGPEARPRLPPCLLL